MTRVKPHLKLSLIEEARRSEKPRLADMPNLWAFNFNYLDTAQGQTFDDWHNEQLLVKLLEHIRHYSEVPCAKALNDGKFVRYKCFPPNSEFKHPEKVPEDAVWARIKLQGKTRFCGHIYRNVFYAVFLDKNHQFCPSEY